MIVCTFPNAAHNFTWNFLLSSLLPHSVIRLFYAYCLRKEKNAEKNWSAPGQGKNMKVSMMIHRKNYCSESRWKVRLVVGRERGERLEADRKKGESVRLWGPGPRTRCDGGCLCWGHIWDAEIWPLMGRFQNSSSDLDVTPKKSGH